MLGGGLINLFDLSLLSVLYIPAGFLTDDALKGYVGLHLGSSCNIIHSSLLSLSVSLRSISLYHSFSA